MKGASGASGPKVVRSTVEETLNALPDAEAAICAKPGSTSAAKAAEIVTGGFNF